jgi:ribosomal protein S18 acetylase RimI-like enzyme
VIELRRVESDGDAAVCVRLRNEIHPRDPQSEQAFAEIRKRPRRLDLLALVDGEPVGIGACGEHWVDPDGPVAFVNVRVRAADRRHGVGTALFRRLSDHAREHGRELFYTAVPADDRDSLGYLGRRGWQRVLEMQGVALDLGAVRPREHPAPAGFELVRIEPALDRLVYEAAVEVEQDLQTHEPTAVLPFERWRKQQFRTAVRRDLSFAAVDGGTVAGYAILEEALPGIGDHAITGVRRACRGRGIGRALKQAQIEAAQAAGLRELRAANTVTNAPIRALNERLGYRPTFLHVHLQGPLAPERAV